jgi:uncharacterized membrane protein YebE (DUF533 family)
MKFERLHGEEPTPVELQDLEKLKAIIEKAIADGVLTRDERDRINALIMADHKVSFEEMELASQLIYDKVNKGELRLDHS